MYEHIIMQGLETTPATTPVATEEETPKTQETIPTATGEEVAETKPATPATPVATKIRASDFTLEEKQSLVERARKETFAKVAKETGIPATMLYNWNYNFNHNRHMRSKGDIKKTATAPRQSTATRQEKTSKPSSTADKPLLILEPAATENTVATEKTTATAVLQDKQESKHKHESQHKQNPVTKIQDGKNGQDLRIENAILKERVELLTRQVKNLRTALGIVVGG